LGKRVYMEAIIKLYFIDPNLSPSLYRALGPDPLGGDGGGVPVDPLGGLAHPVGKAARLALLPLALRPRPTVTP